MPSEERQAYEQHLQPLKVVAPEILPEEAEARSFFHSEPATLFRAFRHRNYRLFFSGQLVSLVGTWITLVTQAWLVYDLTHSPALLGLVAFSAQIPVFFLSPLAGIVSDFCDRRRLLILTQFLSMSQSGALAVLTLSGAIKLWEIVALAFFQGVVNSFDIPARQSMMPVLVGKQDVRQAISLNSMLFNMARIIGPAIAGFLIATIGAGACFLVDASSYAAVLASLALMKIAHHPQEARRNPLRALIGGFLYAWRMRKIRMLLILVSFCSAFGASYLALLPAIAKDILHQGSEGLGLLYGAIGAGALLGAYVLGRIRDRYLSAIPPKAAMLFGFALLAFSQSRNFWLSLALLVPCSFGSMLLGGSANSIIQIVSRDEMRGRVLAIYAMGFMGLLPWGSLILGALAQRMGTGTAVLVGGTICILAAAMAFLYRGGEGGEFSG